MGKVAFTTKLEEEQLEKLRKLSEITHIPQSVLVRQWIKEGIRNNSDLISKKNENFLVVNARVKGRITRKEIYGE